MIPCYLKKHIVKIKEKKDSTIGILASSTGNTNLEIYYYGDTIKIKKTTYIVDADYPCLIVGKDPITGEEAKSIGFDWLSLKFINAKKEFVDMELA